MDFLRRLFSREAQTLFIKNIEPIVEFSQELHTMANDSGNNESVTRDIRLVTNTDGESGRPPYGFSQSNWSESNTRGAKPRTHLMGQCIIDAESSNFASHKSMYGRLFLRWVSCQASLGARQNISANPPSRSNSRSSTVLESGHTLQAQPQVTFVRSKVHISHLGA